MSIDPGLLLLRARAVGVLADIEKAAKKAGKFDSVKHPRYPAGNPKGGQFRPKLGTGAGGAEIFMPIYTGSNKIIQSFEAATLAVANQMAQGILTGAQKLLGVKTHPDDTNNLKLKSTVRQLAAGVAQPDVTPTVAVKPDTAAPATAVGAILSIKTSDQVATLGAADKIGRFAVLGKADPALISFSADQIKSSNEKVFRKNLNVNQLHKDGMAALKASGASGAIKNYIDFDYQKVNEQLSTGALSQATVNTVRRIETATNLQELPAGLVMGRAFGADDAVVSQLLNSTGLVLQNLGATSTSINPAIGGPGGKEVRVKITAAAGATGVYIGANKDGDNAAFSGASSKEREVLLSPSSRFLVLSASQTNVDPGFLPNDDKTKAYLHLLLLPNEPGASIIPSSWKAEPAEPTFATYGLKLDAASKTYASDFPMPDGGVLKVKIAGDGEDFYGKPSWEMTSTILSPDGTTKKTAFPFAVFSEAVDVHDSLGKLLSSHGLSANAAATGAKIDAAVTSTTTPKPADTAPVAPTAATSASKKPTPFFADNVQLWHGAGQSFKAFDPTKIGTGADAGTANWYGAGFYLSGEQWKAKSYADATGSQGQIASVKTSIENPLKINGTGASDKIDALKSIGIDPSLDGPALTSALQDKGYDGVVVYKNGSEKINEVVVFNADQVSIQDWQPAISKPVSSPATVSVAATPATVAPTAGALGDPPKIASASNPAYQKKIDGLYASVKAGDMAALDAFIPLQQAKVDAAKLKPVMNAHDKWNAQLLTAAVELKAKATGAKIDAVVTAVATPTVKPAAVIQSVQPKAVTGTTAHDVGAYANGEFKNGVQSIKTDELDAMVYRAAGGDGAAILGFDPKEHGEASVVANGMIKNAQSGQINDLLLTPVVGYPVSAQLDALKTRLMAAVGLEKEYGKFQSDWQSQYGDLPIAVKANYNIEIPLTVDEIKAGSSMLIAAAQGKIKTVVETPTEGNPFKESAKSKIMAVLAPPVGQAQSASFDLKPFPNYNTTWSKSTQHQYAQKMSDIKTAADAGDMATLNAISVSDLPIGTPGQKHFQSQVDAAKIFVQSKQGAVQPDATPALVAAKPDTLATAAATPVAKPVAAPVVATPATPVKPDTTGNWSATAQMKHVDNVVNGLVGYKQADAINNLNNFLLSATATPEGKQYAQAWIDHLKAGGTATPVATPKPKASPVATPKPTPTVGYKVPLLPETSGMNKLINAETSKVQALVDAGDVAGLDGLLTTAKHSVTISAIANAKEYLATGKIPVTSPSVNPAAAIGNAAVISAPKGIGSKTHAQYTKQGDAVYQSALAGDKAAVDAMVAQYQAKIDAAKLKPNYPTFADGQYNKLLSYSQKVQAEMQTAATAGLPATAPKSALTKTKLALAGMTLVGGKPGGSNPGGIYQDADGAKWLVKGSNQPDPDGGPAKNEVLAARLYNAAGGYAPEMRTVDLGTQYGGGIGVASKMQDGFKALDVNNPAHVAKAREDFALDAWMANWDSVGLAMDNTVIDQNGNALRIDPGGALLYRAQGTPKGAEFGKTVGEWNSLRDPSKNPQAAKVFAGMTDSELKASAAKVAAISDSTIQSLVSRFGPGDAAAKAALAETMIARKQDVIAKAGLIGATAAVAAATPVKPAAKTATTPPVKPDTSALTALQKAVFDIIDNAVTKAGAYNVLSDQDVQDVLTMMATSTDPTSSPELKQYAQAWLDHLKAGGAAATTTAAATPTAKPAFKLAPSTVQSMAEPSAVKIEALANGELKLATLTDSDFKTVAIGLAEMDASEINAWGQAVIGDKLKNLPDKAIMVSFPTVEQATALLNNMANADAFAVVKPDPAVKAGGTLSAAGAGTAATATAAPIKPVAVPPTITPAIKPALPNFSDYKLEAGNSNASGVNAKVDKIAALAQAGDVAGILALSYGSNTYAKKTVNLANDTLAALGSTATVTAGQKANSHPLIGAAGTTAPVKPATAPPAVAATHTGTWANQYGSGVGDLTTRVTALGAATAAKATFDPAQLEPPKDYANLNGPGQGLSSKAEKNAVSNQIAQELYVLAANGDLVALKAYDIPAKVGGVKNTKTENVVGAYRDQLIGQIENMLNPPKPAQTWKIGGPVTPDNVSQTLQQAFPKYQQYQQVFQDKANMLGRWGVQGGLEASSLKKVVAAAEKIPSQKLSWSSPKLQTIYDQSYAQFNQLTKAEQKAIKDYTGGIYTIWNKEIATNQLGSEVKVGMRAYEKASVELPPGLVLSRKWDPPSSLKNQIDKGLMNLTGKVVQDVAMISTSINPDVWNGSVRMRIKTLPGARGLYVSKTSNSSSYIGNHPSEQEIVMNSKTRFLVTKVSKTNYDTTFFQSGGNIFMDVLALPEDPAGSVLDSIGVK